MQPRDEVNLQRPGIPGIFEATLFTNRRRIVTPSIFIKAMHPKTEIAPTRSSVEKILQAGWVGQMKIHGHRAQIHLPADPKQAPMVYNRQGKLHKKILPDEIASELYRLLNVDLNTELNLILKNDWTVFDSEWIKPEGKLYLFDLLKLNGQLLRGLTYHERYQQLPKLYISPHIQTLPLLTTVEKCLEVLSRPEDHIEGLVFKSLNSPGFEDTSIVRCRKYSMTIHKA